tara:strand:+ start:409 stop:3156 length:2748 start_codon:yes stop_codon:yes gene_type:complete
MPKDAHPDQPAIVAAFLKQVFEDQLRGEERGLPGYQRLFPGHEDAIAEEFRRLQDGEESLDGHASLVAPLRDDLVDDVPDNAGDDQAVMHGAAADRYQDEQEIARGGMGTVYRVWDPSLKRGIAKKVLGTGSASRGATAGLTERFLEEAQVTAQLDHPGIVPVHELGRDAEGRVYYTMSLVRGRNFKQIIDLVHKGQEGWTLTRALGVLQRVCEAVAFAHSKGVIHRDLKPANIMVGPFGQTYVLDWGLARVAANPSGAVSRDESSDDGAPVQSERRDAASSDPASPFLTHEGDVIGTPAYMAPEQARGDLDAVGPRSDVFSIGAMLYHLLAGRMPYSDTGTATWQAMLKATNSGPPTSLRTFGRATPEELIAIQERAMAREPGERYESAMHLGEDLRAFLETRVVRAHRTGAFAELHKWIRRNRLAAAAAALALVSLLVGLGASLWLKGIADDSVEQAGVQLQVRQAVLEFLNKDLLAAVAPGAVGKDATMREVLDRASDKIEGRFVDQPLVEAAVRRTLGDTYRRLGVLDEAERHVARAVALYTESAGEAAEETLDAYRVLAIVYRRQNRLRDAERANREILKTSRRAIGVDHDDTLAAANNLGLVLTNLGEWQEAEVLLREVFEIRQRKLGARHNHTLVSMCNLGLLYYNRGRYREAEPLIKGELDLCIETNGEENPGTLISMNNYANLMVAMGRYAEAEEQHDRVYRVSEKIRGPRHPQTIVSLLARARIALEQERYPEVRERLALARQLAADFRPDHRVLLAADALAAELLLATDEVKATLAATETLLDRMRQVLGDRSTMTLAVWRLRADALRRDDRCEDALREIDAAIAAADDDDSIEHARQRLLRGKLLQQLDRLPDAAHEFVQAERYFADNLPEDSDRNAAIEALVAVYERSGESDKAAQWRRRIQ